MTGNKESLKEDNRNSHREKEDSSQENVESFEKDSTKQEDSSNLVSELENEKNFLLAEIENLKKRHLKEKSDVIRYSNQKLVIKMVSLIDNYETALKASELVSDENVKKFLSGILMAVEDFKNCLKSEGVEEYSITIRKDFWDSKFCQVIDEVESSDYENGTIIEVVKKGYLLNGRMIRPASVIISKRKS